MQLKLSFFLKKKILPLLSDSRSPSTIAEGLATLIQGECATCNLPILVVLIPLKNSSVQ